MDACQNLIIVLDKRLLEDVTSTAHELDLLTILLALQLLPISGLRFAAATWTHVGSAGLVRVASEPGVLASTTLELTASSEGSRALIGGTGEGVEQLDGETRERGDANEKVGVHVEERFGMDGGNVDEHWLKTAIVDAVSSACVREVEDVGPGFDGRMVQGELEELSRGGITQTGLEDERGEFVRVEKHVEDQ